MKPAQEGAQQSLQEKISNIWDDHIYSLGRNNIPISALPRQPKVVIFTLKIETPHMDGDCIEVGWTDSSMEDGPPEIALFWVREHKPDKPTQEKAIQENSFLLLSKERKMVHCVKSNWKRKKTIAATAIDGFFLVAVILLNPLDFCILRNTIQICCSLF